MWAKIRKGLERLRRVLARIREALARVWRERPWVYDDVVKSPDPPPDPPKAPPKQITLSAGGATATLDVPCCDSSEKSKDGDQGKDKKKAGGDGIWSTILKVAGAAAAGITATGFIVAVGAAVFWIRFNEVDLPATQAVGLLAKNEMLVQGAQQTILYLGISMVVVLLLFFVDPKGRLPRVSLLMLVALTVAGIIYPLCTELDWRVELSLMFLAISLLAGCIVVGLRTDTRFWPLALAVFVATLLYSATVGVLVVKEQEFVQGVAVLRGEADAGLTGTYITATENTIYFGRVSKIPVDKKMDRERRSMLDVPREGATYAVGPLESVADAEKRSTRMLEQLIGDRERNPLPPSAGSEPKEDATAEKAGDEGAADASSGSATGAAEEKPAAEPLAEPSIETVAKAFGPSIEVHDTIEGEWTCLVRYAEAGSRPLGHWWTSCEDAKDLAARTMLDVRDALALPARFQPVYDMRVEARLPIGAKITYLVGEIAPQCEHDPPAACGHEYPGGSSQMYLPKVQQAEDPKRRCTKTREDQVPVWKACDPKP